MAASTTSEMATVNTFPEALRTTQTKDAGVFVAASTISAMANLSIASEACHTTQLNSNTEPYNHSPFLPQELWTLVPSYAPYAELWITCRMVSYDFRTHSEFILRNHFIAKEVSLARSETWLSFSHFESHKGIDIAYFKPSKVPPQFLY
jgi:hypothetical protein